jgi:glycosyltransferase involved in cell wall biosynthesis
MSETGSRMVSCLMVTAARPERFALVERSIRDFCAQSHPHKELVIVCDGRAEDRGRLQDHVAHLRRADIRPVFLEDQRPLGALRNVSLDHASGEVLCQWDDDDLQHPTRLERQLARLLEAGAGAVSLQHCLHIIESSGQCYWVNWGKTRYRGHTGTVMFLKAAGLRYPEAGPNARTGEDSVFWNRLVATVKTEVLDAPPYLYGYTFHGQNTFALDHHLMLAHRFCESRQVVLPRVQELWPGLLELGLDGNRVQLMDSQGPFFPPPGPSATEVIGPA